MSAYWQAKIWGLLHDPALKALHNNTGRGKEGVWQSLACMEGWVSPKAKSLTNSSYSSQWLKRIGLCDLIASASDRAAIGRLNDITIDYDKDGIEIRHLLSGKSQQFRLEQWHEYLMNLVELGRADWLSDVENAVIPDSIRKCTDAKKVYWWFWRCYPVVLIQALHQIENIPEEPGLALLPADTRIPDASLWSHTSMTSALAGSLAGYHQDNNAYPKKYARKNRDYFESRPHVAIFSFTPVQELIKASRKMRDFWAGSWLLHYLSAKVCWAIASKYGSDSLLYPCLYEQPLIDLWLLKEYKDFSNWISQPKERQLLTAGFPNVLVFILPDNGANSHPEVQKDPVQAAMQYAKQTLLNAWQELGELVLDNLQNGHSSWMPNLNRSTWDDWLQSQWQIYWTALPIGTLEAELHQSPRKSKEYQDWQKKQNNFVQPQEDLLLSEEAKFVEATYQIAVEEDWQTRRNRSQSYKARQPNLNVGSWWANIFDQTRSSLNAVKNNRSWKLPTAFGPRSTISGIGPVVYPINDEHPEKDWMTEGETEKYWKNHCGLFDGIEELNATEVLKRGLHRILPQILGRKRTDLDLYYPDLCSGVAGWLRNHPKAVNYYLEACQQVCSYFEWTEETQNIAWGIPWVATDHPEWPNPRLLNAGWLIDDFEPQPDDFNLPLTKQQRQKKIAEEKNELQKLISELFPPGNNPTDWYVLAAGDGDNMGEWLTGEYLKEYSQYISQNIEGQLDANKEFTRLFREFIDVKKRMGPSTHSALSRALLDFSNQLVPYLTEQRYAGRLIYGGGDDVLAYTNLWEWDSWLWDIRQCFQGDEDPWKKFDNDGDYWRWKGEEVPDNLTSRPLFTMGQKATISFGIVIAHHSVPLAIALENMWEAEKEAKENETPNNDKKDSVQVRVIYGNGNVLKATSKFKIFSLWRTLLDPTLTRTPAIFEQAATTWEQHPAPSNAIKNWTQAFCMRRDLFAKEDKTRIPFQNLLADFLKNLIDNTKPEQRDYEAVNWLKLAAFVVRKRDINIKSLGGDF